MFINTFLYQLHFLFRDKIDHSTATSHHEALTCPDQYSAYELSRTFGQTTKRCTFLRQRRCCRQQRRPIRGWYVTATAGFGPLGKRADTLCLGAECEQDCYLTEQEGDRVDQICKGYCTGTPLVTGTVVYNCYGSG